MPALKAAVESEGPFQCVPCNREFKDHRSRDAHVATHVMCSEPGCGFQAGKKVVKEHFRKVHAKEPPKLPPALAREVPSKYRHAVKIGETPEEIEKWREARRRNYPTKANIAKKAANRVAAEARGAVPAVEDTGRMRKRKREEHGEQTSKRVHFSEEQSCSAGNKAMRLCRFHMRGKCHHGDACKYRHDATKEEIEQWERDTAAAKKEKAASKKKRKAKSGALGKGSRNVSSSPSLLQKLLAKEVRSERGLLLQCARFFVENNFLMGDPPADEACNSL